ncbi:diguanylate cyclase [Vibrio sp. T187]|uniref:sensor domain-containing diguanylate cyclase n=1 Tax=Vibrio TaxID=662 RepID=UPI0010C9F545|nr:MULTISPECIES: diguanylate cyclase [Vibrio]MBW3697186.1 diguanylate cyclase [Vibrio sp. T187]
MRNKTTFLTLLVTCLLFCVLVGLYYTQRYKEVKLDSFEQTAKHALHQLAYTEREYSNMRDQLVSIMDLLSHSQSLIDFAHTPSHQNRKVLEEVWKSVAVNQKWYTQIRMIDLTGHEQVRINYSSISGLVTTPKQLQDKSQRSYFKYAQGLDIDEIGSWGIDLELEFGEVATPYKPILRVVTPVQDEGVKLGYLVLNIDVMSLASRLNYSPDHDFRAEVVNDSGYYVSSHNQSKLYGDFIQERKTFNLQTLAPKVWKALESERMGYVFEDNNLFAFNTVYLAKNQQLILLIQLNEKQLLARAERDLIDVGQESLIFLFVMLIFALPAALIFIHYRRRNIESKLARAALNGMSAVMISDKSHQTIMVNNEFESMTGYGINQVRGKNALKLLFNDEHELGSMINIWSHLVEEDVWEGEVTCKTKLGIPFTVIMRVHAMKSSVGSVSYYISSLVDITERKELEDQLRRLSEKDSLTQLWNRRKFEEQLEHYARITERYPEDSNICLALVDIDHFKRINDELGHDEGDRVIKEVGAFLVKGLRTTDFVSRVGGEEFAILMPNTSLQEAEVVLNRLRLCISMEEGTPITVSIGFTDLTANTTRSYKCADIALYESKSSGRNLVSLCRSDDDIA